MIRNSCLLVLLLIAFSCSTTELEEKEEQKVEEEVIVEKPPQKKNPITEYIAANPDDSLESKSSGSVANGKLEHGKLMPFEGENFIYFDTTSYLASRAYVHSTVKKTLLVAYEKCEETCPNHRFLLMETANKNGGKIFPHRTHQTGFSVDLGVPLKQNGKRYTDLDLIGAKHYLLEFDEQGRWSSDETVSIDFEIIGKHLIALDDAARENGLKIKKVLLKTNLIDELFATEMGPEIKKRGIYIARKLTPLINDLHDDHYHVDFGF
jgi:penicillin-insensitive murein endopeptidase